MQSSITESIKSLPPLSKTIMDINRVYADEEAGVGELAKVIQHDPMIVANLLKNANSPLYGFGKEIKNVAQAVSLFGMSMTRSIALGNSVRKLLNVDMQPYNVTSEQFAEISSMQATLILKWYNKVDRHKAEDLYLAAFLQETGKILIASYLIQEDEDLSFKSELEFSNNIAEVERSYVNVTSSEVTAEIFQHWDFDKEFVDMIKYADNPAAAPEELREYATALHIVKTILPINKPFSEQSINFGLRQARDAGYDHEILEDAIDDMLDIIEEN
ncbi:HDOD domain-containing protein [Sulfurimonas sp.]|uniref:HDOD domain-containing protein n=1 Tax=Sulfurimonas sp. TaxID=2022749 RepID=UPI00261FD513|nr:HDOD domain-containing protein [Sulfurimonas sp.]